MNRIARFLKQGKKAPVQTQTIKPQPECCSFCSRSLPYEEFKAFAAPEQGIAICNLCIDHFSTMKRFSEHFKIFQQDEPNYMPLLERVMKRLSCEDGAIRTKQVIAKHAMRLLQRSSSIIMGNQDVCPITGVSLHMPRLAFMGKTVSRAVQLFKIACDEIGISHLTCNPDDLKSGKSWAQALNNANAEPSWARHTAIICNGYCHPFTSLAPVILTCDFSIPPDWLPADLCPITFE